MATTYYYAGYKYSNSRVLARGEAAAAGRSTRVSVIVICPEKRGTSPAGMWATRVFECFPVHLLHSKDIRPLYVQLSLNTLLAQNIMYRIRVFQRTSSPDAAEDKKVTVSRFQSSSLRICKLPNYIPKSTKTSCMAFVGKLKK